MTKHPVVSMATAMLAGIMVMETPARTAAVEESKPSVWDYLARRHDKNKDGRISQSEYKRGAETFARLDRNKDGVLTKADWAAPGNSPKHRPRGVPPKKGEQAPDFELTFVKKPERKVRLSDFAGKQPVALLFGSCT